MIRSIAIVPHPPLLVPQLTGAAEAEVRELRTACQQAIRGLRGSAWHAVGADPSGPALVGSGARGSFRGYGVDVPVTLGVGRSSEPGELALPLLVAAWLSGLADGARTVTGELVRPDTPTAGCLARGRELADELDAHADERALLVLGDGATTHPVPGAGRVDPRAAGFDAAVDTALAAADADALAGLDADLAAELGAAGRAAWQVLAGVAQRVREHRGPDCWTGRLLYGAAPYGVGYHVALWETA